MRGIAANRREFLKIAGLGGLAAGALAACAPETVPGATPTTAAAATGPTAAIATATGSPALRIGYLPITDAAPLLIAHAKGYYAAEGLVAARPTLFRSWSQIAEAFQARQVDIVHLLMPAAIWMRFGQNVPVKVVAWAHMDGSALTVGPHIASVADLAGQTVAIPYWYSIHNLVVQLLLRKAGLTAISKGTASTANGTVKLIVMAPPDMLPALGNGSIAGYIVADPFNAAAELSKVGKISRFTGDVWMQHACCVVMMHEDVTTHRRDWAQRVVTAIAKAQLFARENRPEAARLLSSVGGHYLPQPLAVIERALMDGDHAAYVKSGAIEHPSWPPHRIDFQPFPFPTFTESLVTLLRDTMVEGNNAFLKQLDPAKAHSMLVDDRFARVALKAAGGAARFGIAPSLTRTEQIAP